MPSEFTSKITADGSSGYRAEAGRYHLYGSYICPFAQRVMMVRVLKGLEEAVTMDVLDYEKVDNCWAFNDTRGGTLDTVNHCTSFRDVYMKVDPGYTGRISVPVLWDKKTSTIVSNDSADMSFMLATEMNEFCSSEQAKNLDLYPPHLKTKIDELIEWISPAINLGVYKSAMATTQEEYTEAATAFFHNLDKVEAILSKSRYLAGNQPTLADVYLFPTICRFDMVWYILCRLDKKRIVDCPNLWGYTRDIYQIPGMAATINRHHIHTGSFTSKFYGKNGTGIVTLGPDLDFMEPHGRERLG